MKNLATISLNFSDGEKEIISVTDNTPEIIADCIRSVSAGKPFYFISSGWQGCTILRKVPDNRAPDHVSGYRNGEYSWTHDNLYAKHFSKATAERHIKELYKKGE